MSISFPSLVLAAWVPISVLLYARFGAVRGAMIALLAGWILLPTEVYPPEPLESVNNPVGLAVHAVALAAPPLWNKAAAIGLGCLVGILIFDGEALRRLRFRGVDAAFLIFAATPILSAWSNGLPIAGGLAQSRHLVLAWGAPYLAGRTRFATNPALLEMGRAWAIAGLATAPAALVEFVTGPVFYEWVYGPNPYRFDGDTRHLGHRPLLLMEHGNQWGTWAATTALAAAWLWASGERELVRVGRLSISSGRAAVILIAVAILGQSLSGLVWLGCGLAWLAVIRRWIPMRAIWGGIAAALAVVALVAAFLILRAGGPAGIRHSVRGFFLDLGKSSFTWRLARIAENAGAITGRPWLGHGIADWSPTTPEGRFVAPVALAYPMIEAGFHGVIAALSSMTVLAAPIFLAIGRRDRPNLANAPVPMAISLLALNVADLSLNSCLLPPILVAAGGLTAWSTSEPG